MAEKPKWAAVNSAADISAIIEAIKAAPPAPAPVAEAPEPRCCTKCGRIMVTEGVWCALCRAGVRGGAPESEGESPNWAGERREQLKARGFKRINDPRAPESETAGRDEIEKLERSEPHRYWQKYNGVWRNRDGNKWSGPVSADDPKLAAKIEKTVAIAIAEATAALHQQVGELRRQNVDAGAAVAAYAQRNSQLLAEVEGSDAEAAALRSDLLAALDLAMTDRTTWTEETRKKWAALRSRYSGSGT